MKSLFLPILLLLILAGCTTHSDDYEAHAHLVKTSPETAGLAPGLNLNNGEKWKADVSTSEGVENLNLLVEQFCKMQEYDSPEAYLELGQAMETEMKQIFRNCTMTGQEHDELHKFLMPIDQDIKKLKGNNLEASKTAFIQLEDRLLTYHTYFE